MHGTGSTYRARRLVFFLIASVAGCGAASAAATKEECDGLKAEQAALVAAGVPVSMERGAEWARVNLNAKGLAAIKRYIEVSEQITFRCETLRPLNARIEQTESEPKEVEVKDADAAEPKPPEAAPVKPKPKASPKPKVAAEAADPPAQGPIKPAAKVAPKTKPNDAFVPPPAAPGAPAGLDAQAIRKTP